MEIIETFGKWVTDGTLLTVGVIMVGGVFIARFFFTTSWGQWKSRGKQDDIYGKPGSNLKRGKHRNRQER